MATLNERMLALMNMRGSGGASEFEYQRALGYMAQQDALGNPLDAAQALAWARAQQAQQPNVGTYSTPNGGVQAALQQAGIAPQATDQTWAPAQGRLSVATADPATWTNYQNQPMNAEEQRDVGNLLAAGMTPQAAVEQHRAWASQKALKAATTPAAPVTSGAAPVAPVTGGPASGLAAIATGGTGVASVPPVQDAYAVDKALQIAGVPPVGEGAAAAARVPMTYAQVMQIADVAQRQLAMNQYLLDRVGPGGVLVTPATAASVTPPVAPLVGEGGAAAASAVSPGTPDARVVMNARTVETLPTLRENLDVLVGMVQSGIMPLGEYTYATTYLTNGSARTAQEAMTMAHDRVAGTVTPPVVPPELLGNRDGGSRDITGLGPGPVIDPALIQGALERATPGQLSLGGSVTQGAQAGATAPTQAELLNLVSGQFGQRGAGLSGDLNGDGVVDVKDLALASQQGTTPDVQAALQQAGVVTPPAGVVTPPAGVQGAPSADVLGAPSSLGAVVNKAGKVVTLIGSTAVKASAIPGLDSVLGPALVTYLVGKLLDMSVQDKSDPAVVERVMNAEADVYAREHGMEVGSNTWKLAKEGVLNLVASGEVAQEEHTVTGEPVGSQPGATSTVASRVPGWKRPSEEGGVVPPIEPPQGAGETGGPDSGGGLVSPEGAKGGGGGDYPGGWFDGRLWHNEAQPSDQYGWVDEAGNWHDNPNGPYGEAQTAERERRVSEAARLEAIRVGQETMARLDQIAADEAARAAAADLPTTDETTHAAPGQLDQAVLDAIMNRAKQTTDTSLAVPNMLSLRDAVAAAMARAGIGNAPKTAPTVDNAAVNDALRALLPQLRANAGVPVAGAGTPGAGDLASKKDWLRQLQEARAKAGTPGGMAYDQLAKVDAQIAALESEIAALETTAPPAIGAPNALTDALTKFVTGTEKDGLKAPGPAAALTTLDELSTKAIEQPTPKVPSTLTSLAEAKFPTTGGAFGPSLRQQVLDLVASQFGQRGAGLSGDLNGDGVVDINDLTRASQFPDTSASGNVLTKLRDQMMTTTTATVAPAGTPSITPAGAAAVTNMAAAAQVAAPTITAQSGSTIGRLKAAMLGTQQTWQDTWMPYMVVQAEAALGRHLTATEIDAAAVDPNMLLTYAQTVTPGGAVTAPTVTAPGTTVAPTITPTGAAAVAPIAPIGTVAAPTITGAAAVTAPTVTAQSGSTIGRLKAAMLGTQQTWQDTWMPSMVVQAEAALGRPLTSTEIDAAAADPNSMLLMYARTLTPAAEALSTAKQFISDVSGAPAGTGLAAFTPTAGTALGLDEAADIRARQMRTLGPQAEGTLATGVSAALKEAGIISPEQMALQKQAQIGTSDILKSLLLEAQGQPSESRLRSEQALMDQVRNEIARQSESLGSNLAGRGLVGSGTALGLAGEMRGGLLRDVIAQQQQGREAARQAAIQSVLGYTGQIGQQTLAEKTLSVSTAMQKAGLSQGAIDSALAQMTSIQGTASAEATARLGQELDRAVAAGQLSATERAAAMSAATSLAGTLGAQGLTATGATQAAETAAADRALQAALASAGFQVQTGEAAAARAQEAALATAGYGVQTAEAAAARAQQAVMAEAAAKTGAAETAAARAQAATLAGAGYEFAGREAAADRELQASLANQGVQVSTAEAAAARAQATREAKAGYEFAGGQSEADRAMQIALANAGYQVSTGEAAATRATQAAAINAAAANAAAEAAAGRAQEAILTGAGQAFTAGQTAQALTLEKNRDAVNAVLAALGLEQQGALAAGTLGLQGATAAAEEARLRAGQTEAARQFDVTAQMGAAEAAAGRAAETQKFIAEQQRLTGATGLQAALEAAGLAQAGALTREQMAATAKTTATEQLMAGLTLSQQLQQGQISFDEAVTSGRLNDFLKTSESVARQVSQTETLDLQARNQALDYLRVVNETKDAAAALAQRNAEFRAQLTAAQAAMEEENDAQTTAAWLTFIASAGSALLDSLPDVLKAIRKEKE